MKALHLEQYGRVATNVRAVHRLPWLIAGFSLLVAACSSAASTFPDDAIAIRVNSEVAAGNERLLVAVSQLDGTRLGSPVDRVRLAVAPESDPSRVQTVDAVFDWTIEDAFGFYRGEFAFDQLGLWQLTVVPEEGDPLDTVLFEVQGDACRLEGAAAPCAPRVGEPAPSLFTPSLDTASLADLTTDGSPDERFYRLSLDDALANGRPTVVVFSTPAHCRTATCGPILENLKTVVGDFPGFDFVHIEIYTGLQQPDFAPDPSHVAAAVTAWALPSEPWVFVTDASGVITARFEGTLSAVELRARL